MNRIEKLDSLLSDLDKIYRKAKAMKVEKSTLEAINKACENVELDLREESTIHEYEPWY